MRGKVNQLLSVVVWWGAVRCKLWYGPHKAGELKNGWSELVALRVQASRDNLLAARLLPQRIIDAACFRAFQKKIIPEGANGVVDKTFPHGAKISPTFCSPIVHVRTRRSRT